MKIPVLALALFLCLGLMSHARDSNADMVGTWHFVLDTEGGDRSLDLVFKQNGDKLTTTAKDGEHQVNYADGKFNVEFPMSSEEAGDGTLKLKGQLAGGTLTGEWQFQEYSGVFKATKKEQPSQSR
ncbi:MAG: hypothetical protein JO270_05715 [Acidobacteriaceae bacterium]|nr:hypothetical protein [Acidobacteriaceae bacterium]MBV8570137.1 hypothetical protein [Acidobacteriaceae bacterium]